MPITGECRIQVYIGVQAALCSAPRAGKKTGGADKVLLFDRSMDRIEQEAIGIELEEDDGANGLTEDWSKVEQVCQRLDKEWSARAKGKTCDAVMPTQSEEGV